MRGENMDSFMSYIYIAVNMLRAAASIVRDLLGKKRSNIGSGETSSEKQRLSKRMDVSCSCNGIVNKFSVEEVIELDISRHCRRE
jgi:hypothetical protein